MIKKLGAFCALLGVAGAALGPTRLSAIERKVGVREASKPWFHSKWLLTAISEDYNQQTQRSRRRPFPPLPRAYPLCPHRPLPQRFPLRTAQRWQLQSAVLVRCNILRARRTGHSTAIRRNRRYRPVAIPAKRNPASIGSGYTWDRRRA